MNDGDKVKIDYTGSFEDGTVFDSSEKHGQPLEFEIGAKQVILGFENAVKDLKVGEETEVTLQPKEAYGDINPQLMQEVPKDRLPPGEEIKEGMVLVMGLPNGQKIPAKVAKVSDSSVTIDLNHPLAGKVLKFKIKLVEVKAKQ